MRKRNKERLPRFKSLALSFKYMINYAQMRNPNDLCYLGRHACIVTKKEILGRRPSTYALWLKAESSDYSGFIFVGDEFDRAKVGKEFGQFSVVHNYKNNIFKFSRNPTPDGAIDEIVKEGKKCFWALVFAVPLLFFILIDIYLTLSAHLAKFRG